MEAGETVDAAAYALAVANQTVQPSGHTCFDILAVPSMREIEEVVLQMPRAKAAGLDGVTVELLQVHTPSAARQLLPVFLKASLSVREPTAFKGGQLMILAKKAFAAVECSHFRSILLASVPAKAYHRIVRRHLAPHLAAFKDELQSGSLPGTGTETLLLLARTIQDVGKVQQQRTCHLFFDIRSAFYMLLRQLVTDIGEEDETFLRLLHQMGVPQEALQELLQHLQTMAAVPAAGASSHLSAITADLFRGSWFRLEGSSAVALTHKGLVQGTLRQTFSTPSALQPCISAWMLHLRLDSFCQWYRFCILLRSFQPCPARQPLLWPPGQMTVFGLRPPLLCRTWCKELPARFKCVLNAPPPWASSIPVGLRRQLFYSQTPRPVRASTPPMSKRRAACLL